MLTFTVTAVLVPLFYGSLGCVASFVYDPSLCLDEVVPTLAQYNNCASKVSVYAPAQAKCESVTYRTAANACDATWRTCATSNGCAIPSGPIQYGGCDACDESWDNCLEGADNQECACFAAKHQKYCSSICTVTADCKQAIPSNSHRYCAQPGTCTFKCNTKYTLSKTKNSCVKA